MSSARPPAGKSVLTIKTRSMLLIEKGEKVTNDTFIIPLPVCHSLLALNKVTKGGEREGDAV